MKAEFKPRIYAPARTIDGQILPNDVILVYAVISMLSCSMSISDTYYMSIREIARLIYKIPKPSSRQCNKIMKSIEKINFFIPNAVSSVPDDRDIIKITTKSFIERDYEKYRYGFVYPEDLDKILNIPDCNVFNICGFYFKYVSTFDTTANVGHISSAYVAGLLGVTEQTVKNHIKTLLNCKALMKLKTPSKKVHEHGYYKFPDIYYRPYDEKFAIKYKQECNIKYYHNTSKHSQSP